MTGTSPERIVVVGYGPVAARFIDALRPLAISGTVDVTVVGEERVPAYNRVLLADLGTGRVPLTSMALSDPEELAGDGIRVLLDTAVRRVDRSSRRVLLDGGTWLPYDRLVFATGARATVPNLTGLNPSPIDPVLPVGVTTLRDLGDAERLQAAVTDRRHVVVLGGGVLGLEAALAAAEEGCPVTVVHHGERPMGRQLDTGSGATLMAALRSQGLTLIPNARAVAVSSENGVFQALELSDGTLVEGELLVLACGARPRKELAEGAGLAVGAGILVDHSLRALHTEHVFAIGDCAEIRCPDPGCRPCSETTGPSGLIAPGWRQADWLAASFAARLTGAAPPAALPEEKPGIILLKATGVNLAAAGDLRGDPWTTSPEEDEVSLWADTARGRYVKMCTQEGVLTGFVALGMPRVAAELTLLFGSGGTLPDDRSTLLRLDGPEAAPGTGGSAAGPESVLCRCAGVTQGSVEEAITEGCSSVEDVSRFTKAGTGCGGCKDGIRGLIETHFSRTAA
ncbi:FAD-dependent oxidoreductase [Arthrobacter sp. RCC_34]|uniref:FAD-dependent oxidoreductase n=1 Tax=Arthrobacter sp. RCC_34 TaxID=3239230 RepID=UPI003525C2AC